MKPKHTSILRLVFALCVLAPLFGCAGTATRESTGEYVDDSSITTKVKAELARDSTVSAMDVHVTTYKGTVELSGFVDTADQKARAGELAKNVPGVGKVQNKISVK